MSAALSLSHTMRISLTLHCIVNTSSFFLGTTTSAAPSLCPTCLQLSQSKHASFQFIQLPGADDPRGCHPTQDILRFTLLNFQTSSNTPFKPINFSSDKYPTFGSVVAPSLPSSATTVRVTTLPASLMSCTMLSWESSTMDWLFTAEIRSPTFSFPHWSAGLPSITRPIL